MIIDSVGYLGSWPHWDPPIKDANSLVSLMDAHRIDQLFVCSTRGLFDDWERGNAEVLRLASQHPKRIRPAVTFGAESMTETVPTDHVCRLLEEYRKEGVKALRLFPQHQNYTFESAYVQPVLEQAARLGFVFQGHVRTLMNWGMPVSEVSNVERLAGQFAQTKVIVCGANSEWPQVASAMRRMPNLLVETSCLQYLGRVEFFTREFGAERVLFGSGTALQYPACGLVKVVKAKISPDERQRILGGNAENLF